MTYFSATFPTPFGPFSVAVNADGAVVATAFGNQSSLRQHFKPGSQPIVDSLRCAPVREQVAQYFAGTRTEFDLALAPQGTTFQQSVWRALQRIPFGRTITYGSLAAKLRRPGAARAVGRANATNPICLIIPCHRVIGADGSLTGFAYGVKLKRRLLALEGVALPA